MQFKYLSLAKKKIQTSLAILGQEPNPQAKAKSLSSLKKNLQKKKTPTPQTQLLPNVQNVVVVVVVTTTCIVVGFFFCSQIQLQRRHRQRR